VSTNFLPNFHFSAAAEKTNKFNAKSSKRGSTNRNSATPRHELPTVKIPLPGIKPFRVARIPQAAARKTAR
jgi:hypothetical protein